MTIVTQPWPLAQRYRPSRFADVIGQDVFVSVLTKALAQHRVSHGVLLTGIRGVGKTTLARLLAKALCCPQRGDNGEPCLQCSSCVSAAQDKHVDIVELDAASHTGVDDMRVILDSCPYQPLMGQHKVYIMDEVHMLSKSAFNALLKTLEEPPAHVTFIFATTELHKVPATIVSRCQQLHLHRLQDTVLAAYLVHVASCEGRTLEHSAAALITKISEGGVRDALSLLERVLIVSSTTQPITHHVVESLLGLPSEECIHQLMHAMAQQAPERAMPLLKSLYHQGNDPCLIAKELLHAIHAMAQQRWLNPPPAHEPTALSLERLDQWWHMVHKGWTEIQSSPFPLLSLEMLVLRMMYILTVPAPSQLLPLVESLPAVSSSGGGTAPLRSSSQPMPSGSLPGHDSGSLQTTQTDPSTQATQAMQAAQPTHIMQATQATQAAEGAVLMPVVDVPQAHEPRSIQSLQDMLAILEHGKEVVLQAHIHHYVSWVQCQDNGVILHWDHQRGPMPSGFTQTLEKALAPWCADGWRVQWSQEAPLIKSAVAEAEDAYWKNQSMAESDPVVQSIMTAFPGATIEHIEPLPPSSHAPHGAIESAVSL